MRRCAAASGRSCLRQNISEVEERRRRGVLRASHWSMRLCVKGIDLGKPVEPEEWMYIEFDSSVGCVTAAGYGLTSSLSFPESSGKIRSIEGKLSMRSCVSAISVLTCAMSGADVASPMMCVQDVASSICATALAVLRGDMGYG